MGMKEIAVGRRDASLVPLDKIVVVEGRNIRKDFGDIDDLAQKIAKSGQEVPGIVRVSEDGQHIELIDGERRFRAIKLANEKYGATITSFLCINEKKGANEEGRVITMLMCGTGVKPLEPLEEAEGYKRLIDYNLTVEQIADKMGKTKHYIEERLALLSAPHDVREHVRAKRLAPSAATRLAKVPKEKRDKVMAKAQAQGKKRVSIADVEKETKGRSAMVSTGSILTARKGIHARLDAVPNEYTESLRPEKITYFKAVIKGLDLAMGKLTVDEI